MTKFEILKTLKTLKPKYEKEGLSLIGLFGSYARESQKKYSDIDIAYQIDYDKFSKKYKGGFSKLLRIDSIKEELENIFKTKVDFIPNSNEKILKDMIHV